MPLGGNTPGLSKFTDIIATMIQRDKESQPRLLDFGVIQDDWALKCNSYPVPIPKESYLICRSVSLPNKEMLSTEMTEAKNKTHLHKAEDEDMMEQDMAPVPVNDIVKLKYVTVIQIEHLHEYDVARPSEPRLKPGDRVLVAWVSNDPVVVDVLTSVNAFLRRDGG